MPQDTRFVRPLPLVGALGTGSHDTCRYKCGDACFSDAPNTSDNPLFADVLAAVVTRRGLLKAGMAASVLAGTSGLLTAAPAEAAIHGGNADLLTFTPILPTTVDDVIVPDGYDYRVLIRWGDPLLPGAPDFDVEAQTPEAQAGQFGYNCDYVAFFPFRDRFYSEDPTTGGGSRRGLLWVNHEYTNPELMFRGYDPSAPTADQVEIEMHAHGGTIVEIRRELRTRHFGYRRDSRFNRRIDAFTPMELTGPAAGDALLRTGADPSGRHVLGMLNNCAGGVTPWGTVLTGEENFHQYFSRFDPATIDPAVAAAHRRYAITAVDPEDGDYQSQRGWELYHPRFDLRQEPNEPFRFGYVVEIDPFDPDFMPRKRTALGRAKHEGAQIGLSPRGRVAVYTGDDERFEYVYKYVSDQPYREGDPDHNLSLLDHGTLYVARFTGDGPEDGEFDGSGEWVPLVSGGRSHVPGFTAAQVLIKTRLAADTVGATKMDRPEDIQRDPVNGRVYINLTNNTLRGAVGSPGPDEANPRSPNTHGHVIELAEAGDDTEATTFAWRIFILAGDPADPSTYFAGYDKSQVSPISAPDNMTFDQAGNLWIATDGQPSALGVNDAFHAVPTSGPERGHLRQFLSVPVGAEACGPCFTPDQETLFCAVQHPGEDGTLEEPVSDWPDRGGRSPRPSVVDIIRIGRFGDRRVGA